MKSLWKISSLIAALLAMTTSTTAQTQLAFPLIEYPLEENRMDRVGRILNTSYTTIGDDVTSILSYPFDNPEQTQIFLLGIGALILVDRQLTGFYQDRIEPVFDDFDLPRAPFENSLGSLPSEDRWLYIGIASSYVAGIALNDERSQIAALLATKAIAYSYLTAHVVLKTALGRKRPFPNLTSDPADDGVFTGDPWDFGYIHPPYLTSDPYGTAMPSFHFAQYFAVARVYSGVYDDSLLPYGVAGLLSLSNIRGHHHWVSDMVAGTAIGLAIGEVVMRNYDSASAITILPVVSPDNIGFSFTRTF